MSVPSHPSYVCQIFHYLWVKFQKSSKAVNVVYIVFFDHDFHHKVYETSAFLSQLFCHLFLTIFSLRRSKQIKKRVACSNYSALACTITL